VTAVGNAAAIVAAWGERVREAAAHDRPLRIIGGGTKDFYGQELIGEALSTGDYIGVVDYDPTEMVITARCGTPLDEVERALDAGGQMLGFEPPHFGPKTTFGGCVAAGLSGPRRPYAGAVRDLVLGVRLLDGRGDDLAFGGRVMKNVAGFDVSRLMVGALGTLGIVLEASMRCLPRPRMEATRVLELSSDAAIRCMNEWGAKPLPISATWYFEGRLYVRMSGADVAVATAARAIGGAPLADSAELWTSVRDQTHAFFAGDDTALWRLSVRSTAPHAELGGRQAVEWGGALRWLKGKDVVAEELRAWARKHAGHATLFRGDRSGGAFQPLDAATLTIHRRLKANFDPAGVFNRHRMYRDF